MDCTNFEFYPNESLESCLLRLSQYKGFEQFAHFAEETLYRFLDEHETVSGALPSELKRINIYHAQVSRQMRVRVIKHLETELQLPRFQILRLALTSSNTTFSPDLKAVHRSGFDYPRIMLRKQNIPVCPECLAEDSYMRQQWHLIPYQACHIHQCELLHKCPECNRSIDYLDDEIIGGCICGYSYVEAQTKDSCDTDLLISKWLIDQKQTLPNLPNSMSISERYGFLLWYTNRYVKNDESNLEGFVEYCRLWQSQIDVELKQLLMDGDLKRIKPWQKTYFEEIFGTLLKDCRRLPHRELGRNVALRAILLGLSDLIDNNRASKSGGIGDVLLSVLDASTLMSCSTDEVYKLYETGEIKASIRPPIHTKLGTYQSVFTLKSIIETKMALMSAEANCIGDYDTQEAPEWS
jgi:hypothetical protein